MGLLFYTQNLITSHHLQIYLLGCVPLCFFRFCFSGLDRMSKSELCSSLLKLADYKKKTNFSQTFLFAVIFAMSAIFARTHIIFITLNFNAIHECIFVKVNSNLNILPIFYFLIKFLISIRYFFLISVPII